MSNSEHTITDHQNISTENHHSQKKSDDRTIIDDNEQ